MSKEQSRREFLRFSAAATVGIAAGIGCAYTGKEANSLVEEVTPFQSGNASERSYFESVCQEASDPEACASEKYKHNDLSVQSAVIESPILEEGFFRLGPAALCGYDSPKDAFYQKPPTGKDILSMTRRELIFGGATTAVFGAVHNVTTVDGMDYNFDTKTIPASQTIVGGACWYLQRKCGMVANILAHATNNALAILTT